MDSKDNLTARVKNLAFSNEIDYVGVAPVERFKYAPNGHKPEDILPGAQSVISMSMRISLGPQLTQRMAFADHRLRHISFSYRWYAYGMLNMHFMDRTAILVGKLLEDAGYLAVPIVTSGVEDNRALMALFSNRHAGVAAGLGEFGWLGLCMRPENGPRQRFVSIITTAELEPTPLYSGPRLCDKEKCTELGDGLPLCVKLCPVKAFSMTKTVSVRIGERTFEYAKMDHNLCACMGPGAFREVLGPEDRVWIPRKITQTVRDEIAASLPARNKLEPMTFGRSHFCGICLLRCPVGMSKLVDDIVKSKEEVSGR